MKKILLLFAAIVLAAGALGYLLMAKSSKKESSPKENADKENAPAVQTTAPKDSLPTNGTTQSPTPQREDKDLEKEVKSKLKDSLKATEEKPNGKNVDLKKIMESGKLHEP
jgi:hypothetical protein